MSMPQNNPEIWEILSDSSASPTDTQTPAWPKTHFVLDIPISPPPASQIPAPLPPSSPLLKGLVVIGGSQHPMTPSGGSNSSPDSPFGSPDSFPDSPFQASRQRERTAASAARIPSSQKEDASAAGSTLGGPPAATHRDNASIKDSDEDDYDSDSDDLGAAPFSMSMFTMAGSSFSAAATRTTQPHDTHPSTSSSSPYDGGAPTPPPAKRRANAVLTSPLPLRRAKQVCLPRQLAPPKHKFDMKALLRHAKQDSAAEAAVRRAESAFAENDRQDSQINGSAQQQQHRPHISRNVLEDMLENGKDGDAGKNSRTAKDGKKDGSAPFSAFHKDRLRRAFEQTEAAAVSQHWYFFKEHFVPSSTTRRPFPDEAIQGTTTEDGHGTSPWAFLHDASMRQDYFAMGVVRRAVEGGRAGLPDTVFNWVLDEACAHPLPSLRTEYTAVLRSCPLEQIRRLVHTERLLQLFQNLGPRWESIDLDLDRHHSREPKAAAAPPTPPRPAALVLVPAIEHPYPGRDWAPLRALLFLLAELAHALCLETVESAVVILLRLAIDDMVEQTLDVLQSYQEATRRLVQQVPSLDWDEFCYHTCLSLHNSIQRPALQWRVLACLPMDAPACHDFRRRLAGVLLFDDPMRARQDPRQVFSGQSTAAGDNPDDGGVGLARLADREDFFLTDDTDYTDLAGLVNLLDAYVDNAGREAIVVRPTAAASSAQTPNVRPAEFDADVDELARRLAAIGGGINATVGSHVSRLDGRTALERVQIRLTHSVRTRRPGKKSVFDRVLTSVPSMLSVPDVSHGSGEAASAAKPFAQGDIRSFFGKPLAKK